jgi:hypothetical protein
MENNKQTAVNYLLSHIWTTDWVNYTREQKLAIIEQAKEMEKQQHATTWDKSMDNLDARGGNIVRAWVDFDEYYEQTFGGNK